MKAIITKIIIKKKGGIVKAMFSSNSNSISIKYDDTLTENQNHLNAAIILCNKLELKGELISSGERHYFFKKNTELSKSVLI